MFRLVEKEIWSFLHVNNKKWEKAILFKLWNFLAITYLCSRHIFLEKVTCCVFWPAFGCWAHWKLVKIVFLAVFNLFCLLLLFFIISKALVLKIKINKYYYYLRGVPQFCLFSVHFFHLKKYFDHISGERSTRKLVKIHNSH